MKKVKLFMGSATRDGIVELESSVNGWIIEKNVEIENISVTLRQVALEERKTLSGEITDQLVVCLTYETK